MTLSQLKKGDVKYCPIRGKAVVLKIKRRTITVKFPNETRITVLKTIDQDFNFNEL